MLSNTQMPSIKTIISAAATAMVIRSVAKDLIPHEFQYYFFLKIRGFLSAFSNELTLIIDEFDGLYPNHLFQSAEVYLGTLATPDTKRFRVTKPTKEKQIMVWMEKNQELNDLFGGFRIKWRLVRQQEQGKYVAGPEVYYGVSIRKTEVRFFELVFHKKLKDKVINEYLPYILEKSKILKEKNRTLKLWTLKYDRVMGGPRSNPWQCVNLDHPATFDKLAMESDEKETVMADLQRFVKRKEFYRRVGKAWKRGYLLFGPPGTGKSSLIAAMANYLNFDVYDLDLTDIRSNSELRNLLISTANRSILVVEDIDCSIELQDRKGAAVAKAKARAMDPFGYEQGSNRRKDFYRRVGKAWKRGYLLFGPPGTGKSSLIAAMANYLNFDVYDLELTDIRSNSELRNLLVSTANRSILVVEDIDCSIELQDRKRAAAATAMATVRVMDPFRHNQGSNGVTLSGLLNFVDGLWSSCGDEWIIVFTTNHKERLDPALLRPGRMDVHIHMSYCTPCGFKMLAKTYFGISEHPLFLEIEILIEMKKVTPAEVGEQLLKNEEADMALRSLLEFLQEKNETEEVKDGEVVEEKESKS